MFYEISQESVRSWNYVGEPTCLRCVSIGFFGWWCVAFSLLIRTVIYNLLGDLLWVLFKDLSAKRLSRAQLSRTMRKCHFCQVFFKILLFVLPFAKMWRLCYTFCQDSNNTSLSRFRDSIILYVSCLSYRIIKITNIQFEQKIISVFILALLFHDLI